MNNLTRSAAALRMKTPSITSSRSASNQQNGEIFPYKLYHVKSAYTPANDSPNYKSIINSSLLISTACEGVVFCPKWNLNSMLKNLSLLLFKGDKDGPGKEGLDHEKILKEQQEQLEKLKKEPGTYGKDEKFPKYTPK